MQLFIGVFSISLQDVPTQPFERSHIIKQMKGLLKTDQPAPTDQQVESMLEQRRLEKYLFYAVANLTLLSSKKTAEK
ncbi:MAG TPA: hypothetical protein VE944_14795 [Nostoc sp.]|uniref:hypothetical protein n=1 Tax=Nostoc sp. TaxID=1180 RepID=UPI002D5B0553|nr:hypothetical protein [Nostoc sp.]HYX15606.1 hypothetical protein [Nostoc sp.]